MDNVPNADRYPIPQDDRLTDLVVELVADLLTHHGFPPAFSRPDLQRLRDALSVFLYGPRSASWWPGAPAGFVAGCGRLGPHQPHLQLSTPVTALCAIDGTGSCSMHEGFHPQSW